VAFPFHALEAVKVLPQSVGIEGHFSLEAETVPLPSYLAQKGCDRDTTCGIPCLCPRSNANLVEIAQKLFNPIHFFLPISPCIAAAWLRHDTWPSFQKCYKQCKFGQNRSEWKGTLLLTPSQFIFSILPHIAADRLRHHTWHSLSMSYKPCKFGRNRSVTKDILLLWRKQFLVPISPRIAAECDRTSLVRPGSSPAWETKNNNVCGEGFNSLALLHKRKGNALIGGTGCLNRAISRDNCPTVYKFETWDGNVEGRHLGISSHWIYVSRQFLVS
jgi:hypothetical protein